MFRVEREYGGLVKKLLRCSLTAASCLFWSARRERRVRTQWRYGDMQSMNNALMYFFFFFIWSTDYHMLYRCIQCWTRVARGPVRKMHWVQSSFGLQVLPCHGMLVNLPTWNQMVITLCCIQPARHCFRTNFCSFSDNSSLNHEHCNEYKVGNQSNLVAYTPAIK